jgi:hypothetical protein
MSIVEVTNTFIVFLRDGAILGITLGAVLAFLRN